MTNYLLPINLLIADDHQLFVDGMRRLLETEKMFGEIHGVNNGLQVLEHVKSHPVDCIIMDINMPFLNGLETTKQLKKDNPEIKIIVVSMECDVVIVSKMLKAGADAFINKDTGKEELMTAFRKISENEKYVSPDIAKNLFSYLSYRKKNVTEDEKHLTPREIEIIRHIADGETNAEIAAKLFLSVVTVDTHRKNILSKLELKNTAALVKYAVENKLLL
jgi:two-component system, NarL family, nitrate/nitrite response regulator NarL